MHYVYEGDFPDELAFGPEVAIDTETLGLVTKRDRLCLLQLSDGSGVAHMVHFPKPVYEAPNLCAVLSDPNRRKIFHFARFDMAAIRQYLGVDVQNVYCTKIASKIARTFTEKHGLASLCRDLLGKDVDKRQQMTDWAQTPLKPAQVEYAATDVIYLHALRRELDRLLTRENRLHLAYACFKFLPTQVMLDLMGWPEDFNVFSHR